MTTPTDTELLDELEKYVKENDYILIHNLTGSDDSRWPSNRSMRGIGLIPYSPRTLREALISALGLDCK